MNTNLSPLVAEPIPASSSAVRIPAQDRVSLRDKIIFGFGGSVEGLTTSLSTGTLWMPVFNIGFGISPALLGMILMFLRCFDAFADPIMGNISDNTRTKWGRRRPWIVVGAMATGLTMPLLWWPSRAWGQTGMAIYIALVGVLLFCSFTVWAMPFHSFSMELTSNYDERTRITAVGTVIAKVMGLASGWVFAIVSGPWFNDPATGKPDIVHGVRIVSLFVSIVVIGVGILPGIFVKERFYEKETRAQAREPLLESLRSTFKNRPLRMLVGIVFFQMLGSVTVSVLGQYVNIFYVNSGAMGSAAVLEGWKITSMFVAGIISVPFWTWFAEKFDKKFAMYVVLGSAFVGHAMNLVCLDPARPYLQLLPAVFYSAITGSMWLILPSMKMDVADHDESETAKRREGSLNALFSWSLKLASTLAIGLGAWFLQLTGFDAARGTIQPPEVLNRMFWFYICLPYAFWSVGLWFLYKYPLNREKLSAIRAQLELRRGCI